MRLPVLEPVLELGDKNVCLSETPLSTRQRRSGGLTASHRHSLLGPVSAKKAPTPQRLGSNAAGSTAPVPSA